MVKERVCKTCGNSYPLNSEFFHVHPTCKDGFLHHCKLCSNKKREDSYNASLIRVLNLRCRKAKTRAKKKGIEFNITIDYLCDLWKLQDGKCYYSGLDMSWDRNDLYTVSIDKVDSSKGYTKDNVVLVCWSVNKMKNDYSLKYFKMICQSVANVST